MITRKVGEAFKVVVSTKKTLFGAQSGDFSAYYAPVDNLQQKTVVAGGATEAELATASRSATLTANAAINATTLTVDSSTNTLLEGDTIEYSTGKYAYIKKIDGATIYINKKLLVAVPSGATINQSVKLGEYTTQDISIADPGEYIVSVEGSKYSILVEQRIKIVEEDVVVVDGNNDEVVAVGY